MRYGKGPDTDTVRYSHKVNIFYLWNEFLNQIIFSARTSIIECVCDKVENFTFLSENPVVHYVRTNGHSVDSGH